MNLVVVATGLLGSEICRLLAAEGWPRGIKSFRGSENV